MKYIVVIEKMDAAIARAKGEKESRNPVCKSHQISARKLW